MRFPHYAFAELEPQIVEYWRKNLTVEKLRRKNLRGKKFYFLDGPPYTSGRFHLAHAWNYALKDIALRYLRSRGYNLWDRNGFDVHGLPTEHQVMDKHQLNTKQDIQNFGVDKFVKECEQFCLEMAELMSRDLGRMGITVRRTDPYMALKTEFMEGEWALIKKAYGDGRLYYGEKVLTWCQHCETAVAKHECDYENVQEKSIFVKFPLKGTKNEYLIIWTTTPWTIPFNLAVMAGPDIEYVKIQVEHEQWILAKALAGMVVQAVAGKQMKVLEEWKGSRLEGLEYVHPLGKHIPKLRELKEQHPHIHTVILSEQYVDTSAGTGLVHAAPGCGPEDQEACKPYAIPPFNSLTEQGFFPEEMGRFAGLRAKVDDDRFTQALKDEGALLAVTDVEHEYPHCWRCHHPVIFRITFQWFFKAEDLKGNILKGNKEVHWIPQTAHNAYEAWIRNLKDNSISRQRYWGTPLPIWRCTRCKAVKVIGSRKELRRAGGNVPRNIHIPWIDAVTFPCSCKGVMKRVPDIIDVWVDAGTASWNCLDSKPSLLKKWYPADLILEAKEQTRLWFSMLSICSYLYLGKNAFKNVYVYGMLNDIDGRKMSKSMGNIISPYELIDKHGADVLRYYMCQNNAGQDINFSWEEGAQKGRQLHIFWNIHKLLLSLAQEHQINPFRLDARRMQRLIGMEEKYIISKLHSTIIIVTKLFDAYRLDETIAPLESLFLELSRTYIQMVRNKSTLGSDEEKEVCLYTLATVLLETLKMFSIICPFISEAIYLNLKGEFGLREESITHYPWPKANKSFIDVELQQHVELIQQIIEAALNGREKARLGLRWPIKELVVVSKSPQAAVAMEQLQGILLSQTNAKEIRLLEELPGVKVRIKPNYGAIGRVYGAISTEIVAKLTLDSPQTILGHLEHEGAYSCAIEGKEVHITKDMLLITREVPPLYQEAEFRLGQVEVNTERTPELEGEGYARELMRHIQQLRKNAGLEKRERIAVAVQVSAILKQQLNRFAEEIKQKVGADTLLIQSQALKRYPHQGEFSVKQEHFIVWFEKV